MLMVAGCSDSNSPTTEKGLYTYSHIEEEIIEVYGVGGEKLSQNEWSQEINNTYSEFNNYLNTMKKLSFELTDTTLITYANNNNQEVYIKMNNDTIQTKIDFGGDLTNYIDFALKKDDNTIEFQSFSYWKKISYGTGGFTHNIIRDNKEEISQLMSIAQDLKENEEIAIFYRRIYFKKKGD